MAPLSVDLNVPKIFSPGKAVHQRKLLSRKQPAVTRCSILLGLSGASDTWNDRAHRRVGKTVSERQLGQRHGRIVIVLELANFLDSPEDGGEVSSPEIVAADISLRKQIGRASCRGRGEISVGA